MAGFQFGPARILEALGRVKISEGMTCGKSYLLRPRVFLILGGLPRPIEDSISTTAVKSDSIRGVGDTDVRYSLFPTFYLN